MNDGFAADLILHGNHIFTALGNGTQKGFVAIKGNKIIAVNPTEQMDEFVSENTKIIDCKNNLILPGFHDSHTHLLMSMIFDDAVNLYNAKSEEEAVELVLNHIKERPQDDSLIVGYDWNSSIWPSQYPSKASLDLVIPNRPVLLAKLEGHGAWLNSKALELFNITRDTDDMEGGEIQKDAKGEPTGYIDEKAVLKLYEIASMFLFSSPQGTKERLQRSFQRLASFGVTAISDLYWSYRPVIEALESLESSGEMDVRFNFAIFPTPENQGEIPIYLKNQSDMLKYQGVKFLYDGTVLGYTADLLEPYSDYPETSNILPMDYTAFEKEVLAWDAKGYRVRIHCIGDKAVRDALNIYEACQAANGKRDSRHSIAHVEVLHPDDVQRFAELGVIADVHPAHIALASEKYEDNGYLVRLGKREKHCFNYKSLLDQGASIAMGSDVPIVTPNPMLGIYRAVTRRFDDGLPVDGWMPEQRLPISEVLKIYTLGSAYHDFMDDKTGTLEEGKLADIVVIDRNLLDISHEDILDAAIVMTICDGKIVYQNK
jgi:hypothetical protein